MTFAEAVDNFFKLHCEAENKPSTAAETRRVFKAHWLPVFARRLLQDIGTREITAIIDRHRRRAPHEARHAFAVLRKFFNWAKQQRLVDRSPCDHLAFGLRLQPRTRVLTERELVAILNAAGELGYPYGPIVQLLMVTGQRRGEIAGLCRSYIDTDKRLITLPSELVKNSREHTFPYGDLAAQFCFPFQTSRTCCFRRVAAKTDHSRVGAKSRPYSTNAAASISACTICGAPGRRTSPNLMSIRGSSKHTSITCQASFRVLRRCTTGTSTSTNHARPSPSSKRN